MTLLVTVFNEPQRIWLDLFSLEQKQPLIKKKISLIQY